MFKIVKLIVMIQLAAWRSGGQIFPICPGCKPGVVADVSVGQVAESIGVAYTSVGYTIIPIYINILYPGAFEGMNCSNLLGDTIKDQIRQRLFELQGAINASVTGATSESLAINNTDRAKRFIDIIALGISTAALGLSISNSIAISKIEKSLSLLQTQVDIQARNQEILTQAVQDLNAAVSTISKYITNVVVPKLQQLSCTSAYSLEVLAQFSELTVLFSALENARLNVQSSTIGASLLTTKQLISLIESSEMTNYSKSVYIRNPNIIAQLAKFSIGMVDLEHYGIGMAMNLPQFGTGPWSLAHISDIGNLCDVANGKGRCFYGTFNYYLSNNQISYGIMDYASCTVADYLTVCPHLGINWEGIHYPPFISMNATQNVKIQKDQAGVYAAQVSTGILASCPHRADCYGIQRSGTRTPITNNAWLPFSDYVGFTSDDYQITMPLSNLQITTEFTFLARPNIDWNLTVENLPINPMTFIDIQAKLDEVKATFPYLRELSDQNWQTIRSLSKNPLSSALFLGPLALILSVLVAFWIIPFWYFFPGYFTRAIDYAYTRVDDRNLKRTERQVEAEMVDIEQQ